VAVQWLNQALCFYHSLCLVDSEVLRNRHLRVAAKRYPTFEKIIFMKKIIGIGILFFSIISCGYLFQLENDKILTEKIETELSSKNRTIDFAKVADFEWDSLIILGPYSQVEKIEEELSLNLENIRQNGIEYSDYYDLVVFLKDKKSVKIVELKRAMSPERTVIDKDKSIFIRGNDGITRLLK
jgi:hypothetical protein